MSGWWMIRFSHLLDDSTMTWPSIILTIHVVASIACLYSKGSSLDQCFASNLFVSSLYLLPIPICLLIQINALRYCESSMSYIDRLSQIVLAIIACFVSVILALVILFQSWSCSTISLKLICCSSICASVYISVVWIRSFWRNYIFTADSKAKQSLLLLIRCWCLTTRFKKLIVVSPYFILFAYVMVHVLLNWSADCALPFQHFGLVSALTFLLMGLAALVLLSYGRRRIHLNDSYEQLIDQSYHSTSQRRHHSTTASDVETLAKDSQRCISLPTLWYLSGGIHIFGFIWGILGMYWSRYDQSCSRTLMQVEH
jgi:hypothetical protein